MILQDEPAREDSLSSCSSNAPSLSINRLLALHPRERLFVHPLLWSERHLALLQCRIYDCGDASSHELPKPDLPAANGARQDEKQEPPSPPDDPAQRAARRLAAQRVPWHILTWIINDILKSVGCSVSVNDDNKAHFYFDRRSRATVEYLTYNFSPPPNSDLGHPTCSFAFFNLNDVHTKRWHHLLPPPNRKNRANVPVMDLFRTRIRRHTPLNRLRDPYLVAVIIALAQKQRRRGAGKPPASRDLMVRLLFAGKDNPRSLHLYVAHVQCSFLDKLDFPSQAPSLNSGLDINHWHIPAEPFETLAERLIQALTLGCGVETPDGANAKGSWEGGGRKRKRDDDSHDDASSKH